MMAQTTAKTESKGEGIVRPRKKKDVRRRVARVSQDAGDNHSDRDRAGREAEKSGGDVSGPKLITSGKPSGATTPMLKGSGDLVPAPRYPEWIVHGEVERFSVASSRNNPVVEEKAAKVARQKQPVILASSPFAEKLVSRWSFHYLSKAFPESQRQGTVEENGEERRTTPASRLNISCSMDKNNRFYSLDASKNIYGSFYHVREPENVSLENVTSFSDFYDCVCNWSHKHVCLETLLMMRPPKSVVQDNYRAIMTPETMPDMVVMASENAQTCLRKDLMNLLDWKWLFQYLRSQNFGSVKDMRLHCGTRNGLHPCKYQEQDQLIMQIKGRTRLLIISPKFAFQGLYPYPVHHPYDKYSMVDFEFSEEENSRLWPLFREHVRGLECTLEPGDTLYVPQYFFLHKQDLDKEVIALQISLSQGKRIRSEDVIPLQISRLLEERVSEVESIRDVHHWLNVIARGEESDWIDTGTVKGHRRIKLVESVHQEVECNLGKRILSDFLKSMVDRRLMPTPWLNKKEFREPLYLTDKPFTLQDTRTELEKKYPEFFSYKLKKDGWQVPESKSTVPIPGYNMPADADYRTYGLQPKQ